MVHRIVPVLATLSLLFATTPAGAVKSMPQPKSAPKLSSEANLALPSGKELLREANELWHVKKDYSGALAKFNAAVDAQPNDADTRLQRAHIFETLSTIVVPTDRPKFAARARSDYEHIAAADPDSMIAGIARDGLTRLAGEPLLPGREVECPVSAVDAHARGDAHYGARRFMEAAVEYERAAVGCPDAGPWWVDLADLHYVLEEYEKADKLFERALSVDPWNREAHRYLSDTKVQLRDGEAAVHQLVFAVVSDPVYEAGWSALRTYAAAMGQTLTRVYGSRKAEPGSADEAAWAAYAAAKTKARGAGGASALAIEREAVKAALKTEGSSPFWSMMQRAESAGFLDEAIYMHLLDRALASEYAGFRDRNSERLVSYVQTVLLR